jgi:hypothetical protein
MIINVIDMVDGAGKWQKKDLVQMGYKHFIELDGMCNGLVEMKKQIIKIAGSNSINVLRVWGHGGPGIQNVSLGTSDSRKMGYGSSAIMINNLSSLIELGPYFAPGARVELRGCAVANDQGKMIKALAQSWNVRVQATTIDKVMGHLYWEKIVEARPGISDLFPAQPVPLRMLR